jgi:hypothetical protein
MKHTTVYAFDIKPSDEAYLRADVFTRGVSDQRSDQRWRKVKSVVTTENPDLLRLVFSDLSEIEMESSSQISIRRPTSTPRRRLVRRK